MLFRKIKLKFDPLILLFAIIGSFLLIFIAIPLLNLFFSVDFISLLKAIENKDVQDAIFLSLFAAFIATLIALFFGVPLAYVLSRKNFFGKSLILGLIDLPVVVPHTVAGIALLLIFGKSGMFGVPLSQFNLKFVDSFYGIVVAMLFVSSPFLINSAKLGFDKVNVKLENIARSLGANRIQAFYISFVLTAKSIFSGAIMTWARAISEFGAVIIIAYFPKIAPILIYEEFTKGEWNLAVAIAVLLLLISLSIFVILRVISNINFKKLWRVRKY